MSDYTEAEKAEFRKKEEREMRSRALATARTIKVVEALILNDTALLQDIELEADKWLDWIYKTRGNEKILPKPVAENDRQTCPNYWIYESRDNEKTLPEPVLESKKILDILCEQTGLDMRIIKEKVLDFAQEKTGKRIYPKSQETIAVFLEWLRKI